MGGICTKATSQMVSNPDQYVPSDIDLQRNHLESQISEEFVLNINSKFSEYFTIIKSKFSGTGIKKTYSYTSHISKEDLLKKREEYWDTRTEGHFEAWQTIRAAIEADQETAAAILSASGLTQLKGSIQFFFDEAGNRYEVPIFCINDPSSYEIREFQPIKRTIDFKKECLNIKIRCTKTNGDCKMTVATTDLIEEFKQNFLKLNTNLSISIKCLRVFIRGKELKDGHYIGEYEVKQDDLIQIFAANSN